jgi:hypothetical protein
MNSPDDESKDTVPAASLREYSVQLAAYLDGQGAGLDTLRSRTQPNPPWPEADNPMLGYLIARANEIFVAEGAKAALSGLLCTRGSKGASRNGRSYFDPFKPEFHVSIVLLGECRGQVGKREKNGGK